ncbi:hypothetical protein [Paenibacillus dakarensis]|uniref:prenylated flavin chaperone LpdD n=1 Tax=Paenibacillus dakarensis TaxID=1527293 RepID=UPI0006D582CA|nr:hypothetical protein [Paenibacillus dakarensis]
MTLNENEALTLEEIELGRDILLIIKGGEVHIGAVSTAYVTQGKIEVETTSIPGHKEYLLTEKFARQCAEQLCRTVTVVMGIHYDHLQRYDIERIIILAEKRVDEYLKQVSDGSISSTEC